MKNSKGYPFVCIKTYFQDIHAAIVTTFKDDHVVPSPPTKSLSFPQKDTLNTKTSSNDSSELSNLIPLDSLLSTPSDKDSCTKLKAANLRTHKRDAFGQCKDDHESPINTITRFTIGKSDSAKSANVKRKLAMNDLRSTSIATEMNTVPEK